MYASSLKWLFLSLLLSGLIACASTPSSSDGSRAIDPYEGFNRAMFGFNNGIDVWVLKPIAKGYRFVTPDFVETGVSNFFSNLLEIRNFLNAGLQGKGKKTAAHTGRFLVNSTLGIAGIFDVAKYMGLEKQDGEDFGQTLATWGAGSGPYLVLPLLGPSTLRDTVGIPADAYADPVTYVDHVPTRNSLTAGEIIDTRAGLLETEKLLSGDRYIFIRDAYLQRRNYLINDGKVEDTFDAGDLEKSGDF
jgi:phospholipid-binding lipoprotein MlaA